jgi:beta-glucanase (GH16 family)
LLSTLGKYDAVYGYYEARILFSDSPGEWCAFWLQSSTNGTPLNDPGRAGVEIDIVEHCAHEVDDPGISNIAALTLNWDGYGPDHKILQRLVTPPTGAPSLQGNWHTYGVLWTSTGYSFFLDDTPVWSTNTAVSQRTETVWLSCEVQNSTWAGSVPSSGYGSRDTSTTRMRVDCVRVWQSQ